MPKVYRTMRANGDLPELGRSAACLGVRPLDIPIEGNGFVFPGTGGLSVAPSWKLLAPWRIPKRLNSVVPKASGSNNLRCWAMGTGAFQEGDVANGLHLRVDGDHHGLIEPKTHMPFQLYEELLASTRTLWRIDED